MRCAWESRWLGLLTSLLWLNFSMAAEIDPARLKVEDQLSRKSANSDGSINDKRQDIAGFLTLRDAGSSLQPPLGGFKWKVLLFGKPCNREWEKGDFYVFSVKEGEGDLPVQGKMRMDAEPVSTVYDKVGSGKYGFEYFGYVAVIRSLADPKVVLVKSDKKNLEQAPDKLEELTGGDLLDTAWKVVRKGVRPSEGIRR